MAALLDCLMFVPRLLGEALRSMDAAQIERWRREEDAEINSLDPRRMVEHAWFVRFHLANMPAMDIKCERWWRSHFGASQNVTIGQLLPLAMNGKGDRIARKLLLWVAEFC